MSNLQRNEAHRLARKAIKNSNLTIPKACELCGDTEEKWRKYLTGSVRPFLVPHHWNGYEHPLDIWFVCYSCNALFRGLHNGIVDKQKMKLIFEVYSPTSKAARLSNLTGDQVNQRIKRGECPGSRKLSGILNIVSELKTDPWFIPKSLLPLPGKSDKANQYLIQED